MAIRSVVADFTKLGPLPDATASEDTIDKHGELLRRIESPVTAEEARALLRCFGPDDCHGLAWTLLHLIETAPGGPPITEPPAATANDWVKLIWARSHRE